MWPDVDTIVSARCRLEPLSPAHADEMVEVLGDPALYEFVGGTPPTLDQLQRRYRAQSIGHSADGQQWWCNWIVITLVESRPVGYVQATVERSSGVLAADVAWVIRPQNQGRGLATEAASAVIEWLSHMRRRSLRRVHPSGPRRFLACRPQDRHAPDGPDKRRRDPLGVQPLTRSRSNPRIVNRHGGRSDPSIAGRAWRPGPALAAHVPARPNCCFLCKPTRLSPDWYERPAWVRALAGCSSSSLSEKWCGHRRDSIAAVPRSPAATSSRHASPADPPERCVCSRPWPSSSPRMTGTLEPESC